MITNRIFLISNLLGLPDKKHVLFHLKLFPFKSFFVNGLRKPRTDIIITKHHIFSVCFFKSKNRIVDLDKIPINDIIRMKTLMKPYSTSKMPSLSINTSNENYEIMFSNFSRYKKNINELIGTVLNIKNSIILDKSW